jgi:hypothetical protein
VDISVEVFKMVSFDERLATAKVRPKQYQDVEVLLDSDLSYKREALRLALDQAKAQGQIDQRLSAVDNTTAELQEQLDDLVRESADSIITLRFYRLPGDVWADIVARCPARLGAPMDEHYGYNMQQAAKLAAPVNGVRIDGSELIPLRFEPATADTLAVNQWVDIFATIAGSEAARIESAIWELNVYDPDSRMGQLKKALATRPA